MYLNPWIKNYCLLFFSLLLFTAKGQWQKQSLPTEASFRSIHAISEEIVWAGGSKGTVIKTLDGGLTWQKMNPFNAENLDFRDIHVVNKEVVYLMSAGEAEKGNAKILKTIDGGKSWRVIFETQEKGIFFDSFDFWNEQEGILVSDPVDGKLKIFITSDGGKKWESIASEKLPPMFEKEACFAASGTSLVVKGKSKVWIGSQNRILYSKNKGRTWEVAQTPFESGSSSGIFGLHFWTEKNGVAVGGDYQLEQKDMPNVAITQNGGKTWQMTSTTLPVGLKEAAYLLPKNKLLVVGPSGSGISSDFGKTWTPLDDEKFHALSCWGTSCWAIGSKGNLGKIRFDSL